MKILEVDIPKYLELYYVGDVHYPRGNIKDFRSVLKHISKKKYRWMIGMGDFIEAINQQDTRYNPEEMASIIHEYGSPMNMINEQWRAFEKDISILKDNNVFLLAGNHEFQYTKRTSFNYLKMLCERLGFEYMGDGFSALIMNRKKSRVISVQTHGCGAGVSVGYPFTKLEQYSHIIAEPDILALGHVHKLGVNVVTDRLKLEDNVLRQKPQYHIVTGSFLTNYNLNGSNYAERKGYKPLPIGYIKVEVENGVINRVYPVVL